MSFFAGDVSLQSAIVSFFCCTGHGRRQLPAYGIRHIAAGVVHDILCIVCDRTIFRRIGDIFCGLLGLRNSSTISDL